MEIAGIMHALLQNISLALFFVLPHDGLAMQAGKRP
jgi:hypothetical protein